MKEWQSQAPNDIDDRIKRIYDHLYANASVRTPARIATEVGKLIRTAIFIEGKAGLFPAFNLAPEVKRRLLAGDPSEVKNFARDLRAEYRKMDTAWAHYSGEDILLSDKDISWCCAQLDGIVLSWGKRDVFGDAVEIFRTHWAKQSSGQFFTDGRVTHLAMTLLEFNPLDGDDLIDICSGTGGFLLAGLDRIRSLVEQKYPVDQRESVIAETGLRVLRGQEVDSDICEAANASLSFRLGRPAAQIVHNGDSLRSETFSSNGHGLREGSHLCAASNPPFGTKITVKDPEILSHFELAQTSNRATTPRPPDILLLEKNVRMLVPGKGRLAIVIPYQILSGPQSRYIREWLLLNTHLGSVVDLPHETFQPHTGTKTSLLVVRRRKKTLTTIDMNDTSSIFMATPKWIGHDRRGQPVYRRKPDGSMTGEVLSDIDDVARAFEAYRRGDDPSVLHAESFTIGVDQVASDPDLRLNARYYREGTKIDEVVTPRKGWKTVRLGDVCDRIFFPTRFKRNYVEPSESAVPFLGGANIAELLADTDKWISKDDPRLPELVVREGWLLLTRSGTTGIVSTVPRAWDGVAISEHVIRIVPRSGTISSAWLQTYLRSDYGQRALSRGVFGSVIDEITPQFVADLRIPVPMDRKTVNRVVRKVEAAEESRQAAIQHYRQAISELENLLAR